MIILLKAIILTSFFMFSTFGLYALDLINLFRHSEIAGKNSVFVDIAPAPLLFEDFQFNLLPVDIRVCYLPPLPLPLSLGAFIKTPHPNLNSFGLRLAYHFDLLDSKTDFYLAYSFDLGFLRNDILEEYNDAPVDVRYYDFRIGVRRFFGMPFAAAIETGFKFESVILMLSIKIN